jgi:two-component system, NarL family, nitrate/nitrite response regulator NarL
MRLLISDDHEMFLDALTSALTRLGHDVVATLTDPDAVPGAARALAPDVCVLDLNYLQVERLDLIDSVRRAAPETAMMLLTGTMNSAAVAAYEAGRVQALVGKSCDLETIDRALRAIGQGERVLAGMLAQGPPGRNQLPNGARMTEREADILRLLVSGASTQDMATSLGVSANTVRTHVQHVLDKLGTHTRVQATARALQLHLVDRDLAGA